MEKGALLETFFLQELRSAAACLNAGGEIGYWRTPSGVEIDLVWTRGDTAIAFEVKSTRRWRRKCSSVLRRCMAENMTSRAFGICMGPHVLREGKVEILPIQEFLARLLTGKILRAG